jgi:hypothetical protein
MRKRPDDIFDMHNRVDGVPPLVAGLVDIGVTDPAKVDVDQDFVRTQIAMFEGPRCRVARRIVHCIRLVGIIVSSLGITGRNGPEKWRYLT